MVATIVYALSDLSQNAPLWNEISPAEYTAIYLGLVAIKDGPNTIPICTAEPKEYLLLVVIGALTFHKNGGIQNFQLAPYSSQKTNK